MHTSDDDKKLLSLVVTGRNDEYMGNFKYRIATCINYLAHQLAILGRLNDVEVLVTDWGSVTPLANVLPLSPEAGCLCRFIYVPPAITNTARPDGDFATYWAANVGLRRGRGEYRLLSDADCLFTNPSIQALLNLLDGKTYLPFDIKRTLFYFSRHQVPWEIVQRQPTLAEWDRYLLITAGSLPLDQAVGLGIAGSGQMMHHSIWQECRGYNQQLIGQAWGDAELTLRVAQYYPWMDLSGIGISAFHMMHWPHNRPGVWHNNVINPHIVSPSMQVNDENWGLANYDLDVQTAQNIIDPNKLTKIYPVQPLKQTRTEFIGELCNKSVRKHIKKSLKEGWNFDSAEWEILCALSWYSQYRYPRTYIEFGIKKASAAAVVAAACPGVEIYGIDMWEGSGHYFVSSPANLTTLLQKVGYRGYTRFVSGESKTAFRRLQSSFFGPFLFDLALVRGDLLKPDMIQQLDDIIPHLAPGGMLVFACNSMDNFQNAWKGLQSKLPNYTYLMCKSGRTGLILTTSWQNDRSIASPIGNEDLQVDFGGPPYFYFAQQVLRKGYHAVRNPVRIPEYVRQIWHWLKQEAR